MRLFLPFLLPLLLLISPSLSAESMETLPQHKSALKTTLQMAQEVGAPGLFLKSSISKLKNLSRNTNLSFPTLLLKKSTQRQLGLKRHSFLATYYIANPFSLLPKEIRDAILKVDSPFKTRGDVWRWLKAISAPEGWRGHMISALRETSPTNLWRASRGLPPFTKSGKKLRPLLVHKTKNSMDLKHEGDIATDPSIIPTGTDLLVVLPHRGTMRVVKAKAADTGGDVKGSHIDIPIHVSPRAAPVYHTNNSPALRRNNVTVLEPMNPWEYLVVRLKEWSLPSRWFLLNLLS